MISKQTVMAIFLIVLGGPAFADSGAWRVGPLLVPAPAGASNELRKSISDSKFPDVRAVRAIKPVSEIEWETFTGPADSAAAIESRKLADKWSIRIEDTTISGVRVFNVIPKQINPEFAGSLFVHTHGGAFVLNRGWAGLREAILIAHNVGIRVLSVDYRMPPKHPYPAAINDVVAVWQSLLGDRDRGSMAIGGTSAGGNLALATVLRLKELGLPLPAAVMASTPWADLSKTDDSYFTNEGLDRVLVSYDGPLAAAAQAYANGLDLKTPLVSPVYGDFGEFPPSILFSGTRDLFLSSTARTHRNMRAAGVDANLHVFEAMSHGNWTTLMELPETKEFTRELSVFLKLHVR